MSLNFTSGGGGSFVPSKSWKTEKVRALWKLDYNLPSIIMDKVLGQICPCGAFSHAPNSRVQMQLHLLSLFPHPSYNILLGEEGQQQCAFKRIALLFQTSVVKLVILHYIAKNAQRKD